MIGINRRLLSSFRKTASEGADVTSSGRLFQTLAAATSNDESLTRDWDDEVEIWKQDPKSDDGHVT